MGERRLEGQTLLVIGGSSGVGREIADLAHRHGATPIITGRDADRLVRAGLDLGSSVAAFDATDFDRLQSFVAELRPPIDHVVVSGPPSYAAALEDFDDDMVRRDVEVRLLLPLHVARHARSIVRPGGTVTFLGCADRQRDERLIAFSRATTAALSSLTDHLAAAIAPVRVNLIALASADGSPETALADDGRGLIGVGAVRDDRSSRVVAGTDVASLAVQLMTSPAVSGATLRLSAE